MKNNTCPYCKEEIKVEAIKCKHCQSKLQITFAEKVFSVLHIESLPVVRKSSVSPCEGYCSRFTGRAFTTCLQECEDAANIAAAMEYLNRELHVTFWDIIWGRGDADPLPMEKIPFEKEVRKRFSRSREK